MRTKTPTSDLSRPTLGRCSPPRPLSESTPSPESADAFATTDPNTARIWFRLAERRDGRTVLAARPLIDVAVHRDLDDSTSAIVPLFADVPATHPLARRLMGQLAAAGFDVVPAESEAFADLGLDTEVYDDQPYESPSCWLRNR